MTRAGGPPGHRFSRIAGGWRVGADFFARAGLAAQDAAPRGLVARLEDLAPPGLDCARVPAEVRAFFEDTGSLELWVRSRWRGPWRRLWPWLRRALGLVGQLRLPLDTARVRTRMVALDGAREGRGDARGVVRTDADTGEVFQVFAYGVARVGGAPRMSVAIPLPLGHLAALLRLEAPPGEGAPTLALTSRRASPDDPSGIWFVTRAGSVPMPLEETLSFWRAGSPGAPTGLPWPDATLAARHEQRLFGRAVVEHTYAFRRAPGGGR